MKELKRFYKLTGSPDGHQGQCKQCGNDQVYLRKGYTISEDGKKYLHPDRSPSKRTNFDEN